MSLSTSRGTPTAADTDLALLLRVQKSLQQPGYQVLRTLAVHIQRGAVLVQGQVPSYFLRQVAIECIKRQAGVTKIVDQIEVA